MVVNLYLETTIRSPRETEGMIGYVIEAPTNKGPATITNFHEIVATRNQAELLALILPLQRIRKYTGTINIYADFDHIAAGFENGWIDTWQENKWKNAKGKPVANASLWQETLILLKGRKVLFHKGENEYRSWLKAQMKEE